MAWWCTEGVESETKLAWWKVAISWICGIEKRLQSTDEQKAELTFSHTSLDEKPLYRTLCNVNAIALIGVAVFFWAFFA